MQKFSSTKLFKVSIISVFFLMLVLLNPARAFSPVQATILFIASPFQKVFYSLTVGFENTKDFLASIGQLKKENEILIKEKMNLLAENAKLKDVENENSMLREQLNLLPRDKYDLVGASIIGQNPNGISNWVEIDKGSDDGISIGMPVIISKGILVGRIDQVNAKNSKVILLTNPQSTINVATLQNATKGIIKGKYGSGIIFEMILQTDKINLGDDVVTSGIGGDFPRGLYVGTVREIRPSDDQLFQQAVVTSPIQTSKLQLVFVLKSVK